MITVFIIISLIFIIIITINIERGMACTADKHTAKCLKGERQAKSP